MEYLTLPHTDLRVSRLIAGCMGLGGVSPKSTQRSRSTRDFVDAALDVGISFFDHANIYAHGRAEEVLGRIFKQTPSLRCCSRRSVFAGKTIRPARRSASTSATSTSSRRSRVSRNASNSDEHGEPALLASCYRESVKLAMANGVTTLAFPGISTGVYGYPVERAADVAVATVRSTLSQGSGKLEEVVFCCFSARDLQIYERLLSPMSSMHGEN